MEPAHKGKEYIIVDEADISLDRAPFHRGGTIDLVNHQSGGDHPIITQAIEDDAAKDERSKGSLHRMRDSVNAKRHDAADKLKKAVHLRSRAKGPAGDSSSDSGDLTDPILAKDITEQTSSRLESDKPLPEKQTVKDFLHSPIATTKEKFSKEGSHEVAANIAAKEISHGQEVDLVRAHEKVKEASTDREKKVAMNERDDLLKQRQTLFVRWTLDRHVTKLRILPRETFVRRPKSDFETKDSQGNVQTDWQAYSHHLMLYAAHQYGGQYIGYGNSPPTPSKETIMPNIERCIVASAPFQEFIMTTRRVYLWENRTETVKYLLIYFTLWYFDLLIPGILSAIVYFVLERHFHGKSLDDLQNDLKRVENQHKIALNLTEFIEKRGEEKWADDAIQVLGPWLMVQLCDLANFFEVLRNFYEWRVPHRTAFTLGIFILTIISTLLVSMETLIKSTTFGAGLTFFFLFPISTNASDYRLVMSVPKRVFWNIPTHSEWAVKSIQAEGTRFEDERQPADSHHPTNEDSPDVPQIPGVHDYGSYNARHDKTKGHLVISDSGVRFISKGPSFTLQWQMPYEEIYNLEKQNRIMSSSVPWSKDDSGKDLRFVDKQGKEVTLEHVERRDQAFSQIVGFSDTVWQVVW